MKQSQRLEQQAEEGEGDEGETPFLTAGYKSQSQYQKASNMEASQEAEAQDSLEELLTTEEKDIDMLKMKIGYMTKKDR